MKVAVSEIIENKVFLFLAPDASPESLVNFEDTISHWMDAKILELRATGHSDFSLTTSDGGKAIVSIVDVNNDHETNQYEIEL